MVYAKWELNQYEITFVVEGSTTETRTRYHGTTLGALPTEPTKLDMTLLVGMEMKIYIMKIV